MTRPINRNTYFGHMVQFRYHFWKLSEVAGTTAVRFLLLSPSEAEFFVHCQFQDLVVLNCLA